MESNKNLKQQYNHVIHIDSRQRIDITGVSEVITFNEDSVLLVTNMGTLNIKGKNMKVNKLNVDNGDMSIEGEFISLTYINKDVKNKESIMKKLFK
ncbi:sporulation protein YabP [Fervidicella metallireducens]|uniref:sporulation protein YabP n=1 Tax=Fervidicella metallireducens TaxID=655338 RepID=UPI0005535C0F|nr:sporulation protein YabP [Fervidicella metallireducens]